MFGGRVNLLPRVTVLLGQDAQVLHEDHRKLRRGIQGCGVYLDHCRQQFNGLGLDGHHGRLRVLALGEERAGGHCCQVVFVVEAQEAVEPVVQAQVRVPEEGPGHGGEAQGDVQDRDPQLFVVVCQLQRLPQDLHQWGVRAPQRRLLQLALNAGRGLQVLSAFQRSRRFRRWLWLACSCRHHSLQDAQRDQQNVRVRTIAGMDNDAGLQHAGQECCAVRVRVAPLVAAAQRQLEDVALLRVHDDAAVHFLQVGKLP
mmetsp:Transcript_11043/g.19761  ORF Transcript_11043/g.19761 Transcript_11043/m.19761 type:complete len:256 (+) Transcript_11043:1265-2032(+)